MRLTAADRSPLEGPAPLVAPRLLGAVLSHRTAEGLVAVRLTEVEAYAGEGEDPGSHAYRGRTPRTGVMFGEAGRLYAYLSYGMHVCANISCVRSGEAAAVLLRAGEVVDGVELARIRRPTAKREVDLARGPARLALALNLTLDQNGAELLAPPYALQLPTSPPSAIRRGPRVGVSGPGGDGALYPWRFWIDGDPTVSAYRQGKVRRAAD